MLEVTNTVVLNKDEKASVTLYEALFFYHSWLRSDKELVNIAHEILTFHCKQGENSNYLKLPQFKECETLLDSEDNSQELDDTSEFVDDLIHELSEMITSAYGLENYTCTYHEGDWGLFHTNMFI